MRSSSVSDVLEEINEDIRRDNMTKLWKKYGPWIIGICVSVVVLVGGSEAYTSYQLSQAVNASNAYEEFLKASKNEDGGAAELAKLNATEHKAYKFLGQMSQADAFIDAENIIEAVKIYDTITVDTNLSQNDRDIAALRAAYLLVDSASYDDMKKRLESINVVENAFRFQARELLATSAYKATKFVEANKLFQSLVDNAQTPEGIRSRASQAVALLVSKI